MTVVPSGSLTLLEDSLRTTIADVQAFRDFVGASDQAGALARVFRDGWPKPDNSDTYDLDECKALSPSAIIYVSEQNGFTRHRDGELTWSLGSGRLFCDLRRIVPPDELVGMDVDADPDSDCNETFKNSVGEIIDGLCLISGTARPDQTNPYSYFDFHRITLVLWETGRPEHTVSMGPWQRALLLLDFQFQQGQ